ncbi:MAG: signal peptide peptidase SppA [Pseudomonadota bacterium]
MSLEVETVLERRRLRKQIGLWRGVAIVVGVVALLAFAAIQAGKTGLIGNQQIARIKIEGLITDDTKRLQMLRKLAKAEHVRGVVVYVDSPGGTTTGGEGLYEALRELAEKKPVVAQFGTVAASAAYIVGLATDHIVARGNTITGSVGVIVQWPEVSGLLEKLGVKFNQVKSGTLKAEPNAFEPPSPEAIAVTREMIEDGQKWFNSLVSDRRKIDVASVPGLTEGRIYSGRMALSLKLIDEIGAQDEAIDWMVKNRDVQKGLPIVDWKPTGDLQWPFGGQAVSLWSFLTGAAPISTTQNPFATLGLDGMLSVWQPQEK